MVKGYAMGWLTLPSGASKSLTRLAQTADLAVHRFESQDVASIQQVDVTRLVPVHSGPMSRTNFLKTDDVFSGRSPIGAYVISGDIERYGRVIDHEARVSLPVFWRDSSTLPNSPDLSFSTMSEAQAAGVSLSRSLASYSDSPLAPAVAIADLGADAVGAAKLGAHYAGVTGPRYRVGALEMETTRGRVMFPLQVFDPLTGARRFSSASVDKAQIQKADVRLIRIMDDKQVTEDLVKNSVVVVRQGGVQ
jgi:hypothetical protein